MARLISGRVGAPEIQSGAPTTESSSRPPFPWIRLGDVVMEILGFLLVGYVGWLIWWALPILLAGCLLVYIPNRPGPRRGDHR